MKFLISPVLDELGCEYWWMYTMMLCIQADYCVP